jgi:hypothetical protein
MLESKELNGANRSGEVKTPLPWETGNRVWPVGNRGVVPRSEIVEVRQKQPCLQSAHAQPIPHGQAAAGISAGGQNQPSTQSRHSKPLPGQGLPVAGVPAWEGTTEINEVVELPDQRTIAELPPRNSVKFIPTGGQNHPLTQLAHR